MAKSKKQKELTAQVRQRLTGEGPVRVDAAAVSTGGERGATKRLSGIYPSLEGATQTLDEAGLRSGQITTPSGLSAQVTKGARSQSYEPVGRGLSEERKGSTLPPVQEGVSQRYEQQIGRDHGPEKAAELTAEADAIARRPNPLRSDGHVNALVALHSPSMGGNRLGHGGALSALAKMENQQLPQSKVDLPKAPAGAGDNFPSLKDGPVFSGPRDLALGALGYTEDVQQRMFDTARTRIERRQSRLGTAPTGPGAHRPVSSPPPGTAPRLSPAEVYARAYGQLQEHLDEALHGTRKGVGRESHEITDLLIGNPMIETTAGAGNPAPPAERQQKGGGLGMTAKRTPNQRAQRQAVADLVGRGSVPPGKRDKVSLAQRSRGGWSALRNADDVATAVQNDLDLLTAQQKARRAGAIAPEERLTDSPGANPEQKARRHAQLVFSTGTVAESRARNWLGELGRPTSSPVGVGVPSEPNAKILPARARPGAISPIPENLPTEPARLGRTRAERGVGVPRDYSGAIAAYTASRPQTVPKSQRRAAESNVEVAQTETPKKGK